MRHINTEDAMTLMSPEKSVHTMTVHAGAIMGCNLSRDTLCERMSEPETKVYLLDEGETTLGDHRLMIVRGGRAQGQKSPRTTRRSVIASTRGEPPLHVEIDEGVLPSWIDGVTLKIGVEIATDDEIRHLLGSRPLPGCGPIVRRDDCVLFDVDAALGDEAITGGVEKPSRGSGIAACLRYARNVGFHWVLMSCSATALHWFRFSA